MNARLEAARQRRAEAEARRKVLLDQIEATKRQVEAAVAENAAREKAAEDAARANRAEIIRTVEATAEAARAAGDPA